jgi:glycerol-3-phosphate dehydrogenase (NAD(P)+)
MTRPLPVLMITKGLAVADGEIAPLPSYVATALHGRLGFAVPVAAVAGPAIAGEQAAGRETAIVFTGTDMDAAAQARDLLAHPGYHVTLSDDLTGVELCAALKNFFALGVGTAAGRFERAAEAENGAAMHNVTASLFTQAVAELAELVRALGGDPATVPGLAGVGDLWVTCRAGRNSRMGRLLGLGIPYSRAKAEHMAADTVEGAELAQAIAPALRAMMADGRLSPARLPLTRAILAAICEDAAFPPTLDALFAA